MAELTKEYFDQHLKSLATKQDLKGLATKKALEPITPTLERTTAVVANLAESFKEFREEMRNVPSILDSHTTTLDAIFKNTEHWKTEAAALRSAIKRHERWFAQLAEKTGVKLEGLER